MPIFAYKCDNGHQEDRFFSTITEGWLFRTAEFECKQCGRSTRRSGSDIPLPCHLYGNPEGYSRPSPTRRHSFKLCNVDGNKNSVG